MASRGSTKLMRQRTLHKGELDRLWKALNDDDAIQVDSWEERGQPTPDVIFGAVKAKPGAAGAAVDKLLRFERLRLRLDVFPFGIPVPREVLIRFRHGERQF